MKIRAVLSSAPRNLRLRLRIFAVLFVFLPAAFWTVTHLCAQTQAPAYEQIVPVRAGAEGNLPFPDWKVLVRSVEDPVRRIKILRSETPAQALKNFSERHALAGPRLASFLAGRTSVQVAEHLSYLTGQSVNPAQLTGEVEIKLLAVGWHKIVYRVNFSRPSSPDPFSIVLKIPKRPWDFYERELRQLRDFSAAGLSLTPRLGEIIGEGEAVPVYLEEWVDGTLAQELRRRNAMGIEERRAILRCLLSIYRITGTLPEGIRPKQLILRPGKSGMLEAVLVDLGGTDTSNPSDLLDYLDLWYGPRGHGVSSRVSIYEGLVLLREWVTEQDRVRDDLIFAMIEEVLGREAGRVFLIRAHTDWSRVSAAPLFRFTKDDFEAMLKGDSLFERAVNHGMRLMRTGVWQFERQIEFQLLRRDLANHLKRSN